MNTPAVGDKIKLKPQRDLIRIFDATNWFFRENRTFFSVQLSNVTGTVTKVDTKYNYFYFQPEGKENTYTLEVGAIEENITQNSKQEA